MIEAPTDEEIKINNMVYDGIRFMQSISEYYGAEEGISVWNSICANVDPDIKGKIFVAMITRGPTTGVTFKMQSPQSNPVAVIKCIRQYTGMGLKEAKDKMDLSKNNYVTVECDRANESLFAIDLRNLGCSTR